MADTKKSIIELFIDRELANYEEPTRRGVSKGEKVGYPLAKMKAAVYAGASGMTQKEIADRVGSSHNLIRVWNSETDFKELAENMRNKFEAFAEEKIKEGNIVSLLFDPIHPLIEDKLLTLMLSKFLDRLKGNRPALKKAITVAAEKKLMQKVNDFTRTISALDEESIKRFSDSIADSLTLIHRMQKKINNL
jgi:predicted transcriptional regulator